MLSAKFLHWIEVQTGGGGLAIYYGVKKIYQSYLSGFLISIQIVEISSIWIALCVIYYCIICLISYNSVPSFCISWTLSWTCRGERGEKKRWRFEVCGPFWSWWQLAKMDEVLPPFPVNRFHFSNRKISMVHDFCTSRTWGYYIHTR